jgi:hypothetical protein
MAGSSNLVAIQTAATAIVQTAVTSNVKVYAYRRLTHDATSFLSMFKTTTGSKINGWMVARVESPEQYLVGRMANRQHKIQMLGVYAVSDAEPSETTFQAQIEAICNGWRADYNLGAACERHDPVQVVTVDFREFGPHKILCHFAELTVVVYELIAGGP